MEQLTSKQALEIIGQGIAHTSLKLSQQEHLVLLEAFRTIENELTPKKDEVLIHE